MTPKLLIGGLALAAAATGGALIGKGTSIDARLRVRCAATLSPSLPATEIAQAIVAAKDGTTICLGGGAYPFIHVLGATHASYVTVRPAPGARVNVAGMEIQDSSFLRFRGLHMDAGFNMRDTPTGASHDYQFIADTFEDDVFGIVLYGGAAPIKGVSIEGNRMRNIDFPGAACDAGYAGGQAVTLYYAEGVRIAHNSFQEVSWHYIQGGGAGPGGVTVEHNLFQGPIPADHAACTHLNVWQIWQGGVNDTFSNNAVLGQPGRPAAITPILFETGPSGGTCADSLSNTTVSNNLFVNDAAAYSIQVMTTTGLTVTDNTVLGSTYGTIVYKSSACPDGSDYRVTHNIDVQNRGNEGRSADMSLGGCQSACTFEYNVSSDGSAARASGSRHGVVYWRPRWIRTSWAPSRSRRPPSGYYVPRGLRLRAGYRASPAG